MSNLQKAFDNLIEEQRTLQAKFQETAQALFKETTKEFFSLNPRVTAMIWTQYTPFFNDGDTCEFGVNECAFTNAPDPESVKWGEYHGEEDTATDGTDIFSWEGFGPSPKGLNKDSCNSFNQMIQSPEMNAVMLAMFGNHVKVIATREGFNVDEYDHD